MAAERRIRTVDTGKAEACIAKERVMPVLCDGQPEYQPGLCCTIADGLGMSEVNLERP